MRIGKICTLTVLVLGTSLTAEDKAKVDEFGDGNVVSFHGVTSFGSDDVKKAVLGDRALIVAAHPEAPLVDYLDLLRRKTLAGYRHAGFPDVEVEVSVRSPLVKVRVVEEGSRFRIGDIHVSGAINIDAKKLVRSLALSRPEGEAVPKNSASVDGTDCKTWVDADGRVVPLEPAKWRRGEPARFDRVSRDQLHALINSRLAEMGFESADFEVELVKDPDHGTVHVQTRILDEGPRSIIRQFVVTGNEKNADDDIVRFLGLREGQFFPKLEQTRAIFKLRDSARFLSQDITCKPHSDGKGVLVEICVTEFPVMPRVSEPLSPEHQAVQQLRRWLTDLDKSSTDLVLEKIQAQKTFKCVLSKDGWLFRQYSTGDASNEDFALVATGGQVGLILPQRRRKLTCSVFDSVVLTGKIGTRLSADLTKPKPGRMSFGLGVTSKSINDHRPPFVMDISLSPVSMAHSFNNLDWKYEWKDHLLTARTEDGFSATIDAETGRLIHCEIVDEESGKATLRVRSVRNEFRKRMSELTELSERFPNSFDGDHPFRSTLRFLLAELAARKWNFFWEAEDDKDASRIKKEHERRELLRVLATAVDHGLFDLPDSTATDLADEDANSFVVPLSTEESAKYDSDPVLGSIAFIALGLADELFPRRSWPWTIWRESALTAISQQQFAQAELVKLYASADAGPVCHLITAKLLAWMGSPAARVFAKRGLQRLVPEDFENDVLLALDTNCAFGKFVIRAGEILRELNDEEIGVLAKTLFSENHDQFIDTIDALKRSGDGPVKDALPELVKRLWDLGFREQIEEALQSLATPRN